MTFAVTIECDNEAFSFDPAEEVARILRKLANQIEHGMTDGKLRDVNGNTVGAFAFKAAGE